LIVHHCISSSFYASFYQKFLLPKQKAADGESAAKELDNKKPQTVVRLRLC
jgi:hypothetical protein